MIECDFMMQLNQRLDPSERIFKFKNIYQVMDTQFMIDFLVKADVYDTFLTKELRKKVKTLANEILPEIVYANVNFIKTITEIKYVYKHLIDHLNKNFAMIFNFFNGKNIDVSLKDGLIYVDFKVQEFMVDFFYQNDTLNKIKDFLDVNFWEDSEVTLTAIPNEKIEEKIIEDIEEEETHSPSIRFVEVKVDRVYYGRVINSPRYICDVIKTASNDLTICGRFSKIYKRDIVTKTGKNCSIFTANIGDSTGVMPVKFFAFPPKKFKKEELNFEWEDIFQDGNTIIVCGEYVFDTYANQLVLSVKGLASTEINFDSINTTKVYRKIPKNYKVVLPNPYVEEGEGKYSNKTQTDFFTPDERELPRDLEESNFVVFDLETTGLYKEKDYIIEIAAVKIEKGVITETFSTLINPQIEIPQTATDVNNITDSMVADKPLFREVIGDFIKFIGDYILVAHNGNNFDIPFIQLKADECYFKIENGFIDTLVLSKQLLPGLKKYNLNALAKKFGFENKDAHRALSDTIVTAKIFIELLYLRSK